MVSRSIFSASSILYLRATRKRRAVALRLPHGHMSAGISSPSGPKRPTSASTVSRQSSGWGYSWNTAPFEGAAAAGSFSSAPNQVPNIAASRGGGYGTSRSTTPSAPRASLASKKPLRRTRRIMFERRAALSVGGRADSGEGGPSESFVRVEGRGGNTELRFRATARGDTTPIAMTARLSTGFGRPRPNAIFVSDYSSICVRESSSVGDSFSKL